MKLLDRVRHAARVKHFSIRTEDAYVHWAERTRFLREEIANNPFVEAVFPHLKPSTPWAAEAFTVQRPAEATGPTGVSR